MSQSEGYLNEGKRSLPAAKCDRRLSRAARKLVLQHLKRAYPEKVRSATLLKTAHKKRDERFSVQDEDAAILWSVLDELLALGRSGGSHAGTQCKLIPSQDHYYHEISNTRMVSFPSLSSSELLLVYPSSTVRHRRRYSTKDRQPAVWHRCMYCGKTFMTQYYLDVHLNNCKSEHSNVLQHNISSENWPEIHLGPETNGNRSLSFEYCPATSWCEAFGIVGCYEMAMSVEPYYGRGSGGWGEDRKFVQNSLSKEKQQQLESFSASGGLSSSSKSLSTLSLFCSDDSIAQARHACHELFSECGLTTAASYCNHKQDPADYWLHLLQCPTHKHPQYSWNLLDQWHTAWTDEVHNQQRIRFSGMVIVVIGFVLWYFLTQDTMFHRRTAHRVQYSRTLKNKDESGKRLLRKRQAIDSFSFHRIWPFRHRSSIHKKHALDKHN